LGLESDEDDEVTDVDVDSVEEVLVLFAFSLNC
jgi:hypothetical protein